MSKRIKAGDRVVFTHGNADLHDRRDGEIGTVTRVITDKAYFSETAYELEMRDGAKGIAFRNELVLAEVELVS